MTERPTYYLTTPIYYVNARPHLGHTYTTVVADTIARRKRAQGLDVFFLTGTDEHGQKIERSAQAAGTTPQQFAAAVSAEFRSLWDRMGLTYDDYIRTTEERHRRGVQELFSLLRERGFIYKGTYTGQYCVFDELYVDAPPGAPCPDCGRITETVSEENYFFKLSAFERRLLEIYEQNAEFIRPEARRNEVMAFVRGGLKDLSVSRTSFDWGIPVPGDPKHVIYVWMDALANYITALGYGSDDDSLFRRYWPADLQVIGKEISRFHCVYWPAFLLAAGLPLPRSIVAHGWLLFEQSKMSKSRGNIVRAETILDVLGADALRYFLLREVVFGQDGSFSFDALVQRYNADLANGYGNLVNRTLTMIRNYFDGRVPEPLTLPEPVHEATGAPVTDKASYLRERSAEVVSTAQEHFERLEFSRALEAIWQLISETDGFISGAAPWKLAKDPDARAQLADVLYTAAEAIRIVTALVYPVLPDAAAKIWAQLGLGSVQQADLKTIAWGGLQAGTQLGEVGPVFPRAEKDTVERMQDMEQKNADTRTDAIATPADARRDIALNERHDAPSEADAIVLPSALEDALAAIPLLGAEGARAHDAPAVSAGSSFKTLPGNPAMASVTHQAALADLPSATSAAAQTAPATDAGKISIDDFSKIELRVALVKVAERVPKADKLLRLEVDLGTETRQILAGIAESYTPESLIGRKVVIVANLQPRKLRGLESNGMIVAASVEGGKAVLAGFLEDVPVGARLK